MIYGSVSLLLLVGVTGGAIYTVFKTHCPSGTRCENLRYVFGVRTQAVRERNAPLISLVPNVLSTAHRQEEHVVLSPSAPPRYMSFTAPTEEESIPLTPPPPPYVTPSVSVENENIPLTPPPLYTPSAV